MFVDTLSVSALWLCVGFLWTWPKDTGAKWLHPFVEWGSDLEGPFCETRPGRQCCEGRQDDCSVPILGTTCYCDNFCNSSASDCCPDYRSYCQRLPGPPTPLPLSTSRRPNPGNDCLKEGIHYSQGDTITDSCNKCSCVLTTSPLGSMYSWNCTQDVCLIRPELIKDINDGNFGWRAGNYSSMWGLTLEEGVRYRLGTFQLESNVVRMNPLRVRLDEAIPKQFDARQEWPGWIHPVQDQGNCSSSWAFTSTALLSDRLAIETLGTINEDLSPQNILSCNRVGQNGCQGGKADRAWWYLWKVGVVTLECYPYKSGETDAAGECRVPRRFRQGICPSGVEFKPSKRFKSTPPYRIRPNEKEIMKEIKDNGPVQAIFEVKEDFFLYRSGVYRYSNITRDPSERQSGHHSVRILGWGSDRTPKRDIVKYWLCANSWGPEWGEEGYFRILRGSNECDIESNIIAAFGQVNEDVLQQQINSGGRRQRLREGRKLRSPPPFVAFTNN